MYNEIGSEFWTDCTSHSMQCLFSMRPERIYGTYPYKVVETLSGRTALEHIVEVLQHRGMKRVYLPAYCCHTMIEPFETHGFKLAFYDIWLTEEGLHRDVTLDSNDCEVVLLMDYFGHTDAETAEMARLAKAAGKVVLYDATHSLFSNVYYSPYDFTYGSYRKWVDINCGFVAWKDDVSDCPISQNSVNVEVYSQLRKKLFDKKAAFIKHGIGTKEDFLPLINQAEMLLEQTYHHQMPDERSMDVLRYTDANHICTSRRENSRILTEGIKEMNDARIRCINTLLNPKDVALFVPVVVKNGLRDELRRYLIEHNIYCPVHWPYSELHPSMPGQKQLMESELSLICDQRYGKDDMIRIVKTIKAFLSM